MPPALANEPDLDPALESYIEAFWILSPGRNIGSGIGGIPLTEIEAFCRMYGVELIARFVRFIRALDAEYLAFTAESIKSGQ